MPPYRSSLASAFPPVQLANSREAYRDLLIFEERLKQNSIRLAGQRNKYEAFLLSLVLSILYLSYRVFVTPSPNILFYNINAGALLIALVTLVLFFATGVYSEKIAYAYKFVPQANRALRYYNLHLNMRTKKASRWYSWNIFKALSRKEANEEADSAATASGKQTSPGRPNIKSRHSKGSSPSTSSKARPIPLSPIPPSNNPRGELIFSTKVSPVFREGYEKYRAEWEKKRKPSRHELGWISFLRSKLWWRGSKAGVPVTNEKPVKVAASGGSTPYPSTSSDSRPATPGQDAAPSPTSSPRGRSAQPRPPVRRSGSSDSLSSSFSSPSPPPSRQASPFRQSQLSQYYLRPDGSVLHDGQSSYSSPGSSRPSTPDLIREEDEEEYTQASHHQHSRRYLASASESSLATSRGGGGGASEPASPDSFNRVELNHNGIDNMHDEASGEHEVKRVGSKEKLMFPARPRNESFREFLNQLHAGEEVPQEQQQQAAVA